VDAETGLQKTSFCSPPIISSALSRQKGSRCARWPESAGRTRSVALPKKIQVKSEGRSHMDLVHQGNSGVGRVIFRQTFNPARSSRLRARTTLAGAQERASLRERSCAASPAPRRPPAHRAPNSAPSKITAPMPMRHSSPTARMDTWRPWPKQENRRKLTPPRHRRTSIRPANHGSTRACSWIIGDVHRTTK